MGARRRRLSRRWFVSPAGFRDLRLSCLLTQRAAAGFLGVGVSTVRRWDRGQRRVPWAVVRLLRLLRQGDLGSLAPAWAGWTVHGGTLRSPEGRVFEAHALAWWSLLVAQARAFRQRYDRDTGGVGATATARPQAVTPQPEAAAGRVPPDPAPAEPVGAASPMTALPCSAGGGGAPARPAPRTGLVCSQKQVTRRPRKVSKSAASSGGAS